MGRNKYTKCPVCSKNVRGDNMKIHKHVENKAYAMKSCSICKKKMIAGNLSRHMQTHKISSQKITEDVVKYQEEFEKKKESGQIIKETIKAKHIDKRSLPREYIEALHINSEISKPDGTLRIWQQMLLEHLIPSDREIIWVVGSVGNEGKSWFQRYLINLYGSSRVFNSSIEKRSDGILHALSKQIVFLVDLFIFNIPRSFPIADVPYALLEEIKDGQSISCKYDSKYLCFNTPNIVAVFANEEPDKKKMSADRWNVFNINTFK